MIAKNGQGRRILQNLFQIDLRVVAHQGDVEGIELRDTLGAIETYNAERIFGQCLGSEREFFCVFKFHDYAPSNLILKDPSLATSRRTSEGRSPSLIRERISWDMRGMIVPLMM